MYTCDNCGAYFLQPGLTVERHGFTYGPYEEFDCCPYCRCVGMMTEVEHDEDE